MYYGISKCQMWWQNVTYLLISSYNTLWGWSYTITRLWALWEQGDGFSSPCKINTLLLYFLLHNRCLVKYMLNEQKISIW